MKSVASFIPIDHGSFYAASETVNYPDLFKITLNQIRELCSNDKLTYASIISNGASRISYPVYKSAFMKVGEC